MNVGLYIHFPFCLSKCFYCKFFSVRFKDALYSKYIEKLISDIKLLNQLPEFEEYKIDTVYFGGGTPSLIDIRDLDRILNEIFRYKNTQIKEITLEVNPKTVEDFRLYKEIGITRISLGIQNFNDNVLKFLGRVHSKEDNIKTLELLSREYDNFSIDIIYNIPGFNNKKLVDDAIFYIKKFKIPHASFYELTIEEGTKFYKDNIKIDEEEFDYLYDYIDMKLRELGFIHYEVSNYGERGYFSIHNIKYWRREYYIGLGPASHSFFKERRFYYSYDFNDFFTNSILDKFKSSNKLNKEEIREEEIFLGLRFYEGIDISLVKKEYISFLEKEGFIYIEKNKIKPTIKGWKLFNSLVYYLI